MYLFEVILNIRNYSLLKIFGFLILFESSCSFDKETSTILISPLIESLTIDIDTLFLTFNNNSGHGFFRVDDNQIYFFDTKFFLVTAFDTSGTIEGRWLGMGEDSNEIGQFITCSFLPGHGDRVFFASDYLFRRFDSSWNKIGEPYLLTRFRKRGGFNTSDLSVIGIYDFNWETSSLATMWLPSNTNGDLFIPLNITIRANKKINKFVNQKKFFQSSRTFGKVDSSGLISAIGGRFPKVYNEKEYLTMYANSYIETKEDSIFVSYEADKNIYVYSSDLELQYIFGREGSHEMKTDYPLSGKYNDFYNTSYSDSCKLNFGYYTHLFYDSTSDLLFRSYTTGFPSFSGLQIFRNKYCLGDFIVPRKFNVIGRIGNFYYADGLVQDDLVSIYRFKIKER